MIKYLALIPALIIGGPFATIIAGSVSTPAFGFYNVYLLFAVVVVADLCGDFIYYSIGKFTGSKFLNKIFTWYKIPESRVKQSYDYFNKYGGLAIVVGKIIPNLGWPIIVLAGSLKFNFFKFFLYIIVVSMIKSGALIALGYFLGKEAVGLHEYVWFIVVPIILYLIFRFLKFKK